MQTEVKENITKERFIGLFEKNRRLLSTNDSSSLSIIREKAFTSFTKLGFPNTNMETWRQTDLKESFERGYDYHLKPLEEVDVMKVFRVTSHTWIPL
jgi:hypothetical protein